MKTKTATTSIMTTSSTTKIYNPKEFKIRLDAIKEEIKIIKTNKKEEFYNVPACFDIEASSFYDNFIVKPENKHALMYAWVFGIKDYCVIGRTWDEFEELTDILSETLELTDKRRLIVYVHNLSYDFQFFRTHFEFNKVFALSEREPIQAITNGGIEFRCSYKLSGYSLEKVGEHLTRHDVKKKVGDLDYSKIRTPETPLTNKEFGYIEYDGRTLLAYIEEEIEDNGDITKIPLTKTGKVRRYCRDACLHTYKSHKKKDYKYSKYRRLMSQMVINSVLEYKQLRQTFTGGFTHGNNLHVGKICENVSSFDFTSSYPAVMVLEQFPMKTAEYIEHLTKEEFKKSLSLYCCMFTATFYNIEETFIYDHYISASKCLELEGALQDNGRIVKADKITILLTEQDFFIIEKTYKWKKLNVKNFRRYKRGFLPRDFVLSILELYEKKTILKGVDDKIIEYQQSKENINGCYGMTVTDIARDEITYTDEWGHEAPDYEKVISKYNNDKRRFLFYPWGIWVTAYARRNLWKAILKIGEDYRYSDTDSIKFINLEKHEEYFIHYNKVLLKRFKRVAEYQNFDINKIMPKTQKGEIKLLGAWDYEGTYKRFKYLGAKRYLFETYEGELNLTVSGLNKKATVPYLEKTFKTHDRIFEEFKAGLLIPKGYTGKQIHTYIDEEREGVVRDYLGKEYHYFENSAVHMEDAEYLLDLNADFLKYLLGVQTTIF